MSDPLFIPGQVPSSQSRSSAQRARPGSVAIPQPPQPPPPDPLGLSVEDQVLRPLAHELVLSSIDLANTSLVSRHNGAPPWFEVHTLLTPASETTPARRVVRIRRRPHHRAPNDSDVLCLLVGTSDADRDMTIQFPGQPTPVKVRKFFKKGLLNGDVYAFGDAQGNKWEWRERRYGYDLSLHDADKPDYMVIARYTSGLGTSSRPYLEFSAQGNAMLDLVVATFFALENSMRAISARPSIMRALSRMGSIIRSPTSPTTNPTTNPFFVAAPPPAQQGQQPSSISPVPSRGGRSTPAGSAGEQRTSTS